MGSEERENGLRLDESRLWFMEAGEKWRKRVRDGRSGGVEEERQEEWRYQ